MISNFAKTIKSGDKISVVNNPHLPHRIQCEVISVNQENGTSRIKYILNNEEKFRNVELEQICPSSAHFAQEMAKCLEALIRA